MKRPLAVLYLLPLLLPAATAGAAAGSIPEGVRDHVARRVEREAGIGVVVGLVDAAGEEFFSRGRLRADGPPVDEQTIFEIGSITKVFTAAVLADMARHGELSLDDPVARLLPPPARVPSVGDRPITLADLASHRSGLPRLPDGFDGTDMENPYAAYTGADLLAFLAGHELERDPGSRYEYSNLGAGLLGYALAQRAGTSYETMIVDRIARPLGMTDTRIGLSTGQRGRLARGHAGRREVGNWEFDALAGAGALRSTARDMIRFVRANFEPGDDDPRPALREMRSRLRETGAEGHSIGLGWHVLSRHGKTIFWHNGQTGGYHAFCGFDAEAGRGAVVLANSAEDIDGIGLHLLNQGFELPALRAVATVPADALEDLVGTYEVGPGLFLHVTREGTQLFAQLTGQPAFPVYPASPLEFFFEIVEARLTFVRGEGGIVDRLVLHQDGEHEARRIDYEPPPARLEVEVDPAVLARYVGVYELAPGVRFDVRLDGARLAVRLADQPRFPVFAESRTRFFYKVVEAQITFVEDQAGAVTGLVLHQGGADQAARKIE
jgi:CubicO group peptidase (beta-lactamase class C family)